MPRLSPRALLKVLVEHLFPTSRVQVGGVRYHPVQVKKDGVVLAAGDHTSAHGLSHRSLPVPLLDERSVPDSHGGYSPVVAEDTQRSRIQQKVLTTACRQSDPSRHEHAQHVSVREQRNVAVDRARAGDHTVHARTDLLRRLAAWSFIPKEQPTRRHAVDLPRRQSLVVAVVPFHQVGLSRRPCHRRPPARRSHAPAASGCRARAQTPSSRAPAASAPPAGDRCPSAGCRWSPCAAR